ncbi:DUF4781 domain-containing protein [Parasedimentitalea marina]|uniref:DUF4781 domain-containing protein n=1 Tax=Parasedimentitalea marina TaxID=2483033 RepID=A0A3T0MYZ4_9RHOB|nr:DUF4781 domain-containing protein [Parasedimentitalea marina]AZV76985.1 DUF4781 domain-containing protein [Parasedimentitalea marina]
MSGLKVEGEELKKLILLGKKGPLPFGFSPGAKDADHTIAIHRTKKPSLLGKAAKAEGSGNKFAFGTFQVDGKIITLTCEKELPAIAKKLKKYLKLQKISLNVIVLDTNGDELSRDVEEPTEPPVPGNVSSDQAKPIEEPARSDPDPQEEVEEEDIVSEKTAGDALKKFIKLGKKGPLPFGYNPGKQDDDHAIVIHRKKKPALLGKAAKKLGEGSKVAFGTFTVSGKVITLTCERVLPAMAKKLKKYLVTQKIHMNVVILDATGAEIDSDVGGLPDDEQLSDKAPEGAVQNARRMLESFVIPKSLSDEEAQKLSAVLTKLRAMLEADASQKTVHQIISATHVILEKSASLIGKLPAGQPGDDPADNLKRNNAQKADLKALLDAVQLPSDGASDKAKSVRAAIAMLHAKIDGAKPDADLGEIAAATSLVIGKVATINAAAPTKAGANPPPKSTKAPKGSDPEPKTIDFEDGDTVDGLNAKVLLKKYSDVFTALKPSFLPGEKKAIKKLHLKFSLALKNGYLDLADSILHAFQERAKGNLIPLAQLKMPDITDPEHRALMGAAMAIQPEEVEKLETWIEANYMAEKTELNVGITTGVSMTDEQGGERLAEALKGKSALGELTEDQMQYLAARVVRKWIHSPDTGEDGAKENIAEWTAEMVKDPKLSRKMAILLWQTYQANNQFDEGPNKEGFEKRDLSLFMLENAIDLAPEGMTKELAIHIGGKGVAEWATGWRKKKPFRGRPMAREDIDEPYFDKISLERRYTLMDQVAEGALSTEETDQFVSFMFGATSEYELEDNKAAQKSWAKLLASTVGRSNCLVEKSTKELEATLGEVLKTEGGQNLLFRHNVDAPMRNWALSQLAPSNDPLHKPLDPSKLAEGWESDVVGKAFAKESLDQAEKQFPTPISFSVKDNKEALANTFGQAFGMPGTVALDPNETPKQMQARLDAGFDHAYYDTEKAPMKAFFKYLEEEKIDPAGITPIPITFMSNELGTAVFKVMRLETAKGPIFFDHRNNTFDSVKEWEEDNKLPPGKMTYPEDLMLGNPAKSKTTPADSTEAWIWDKLDMAAMIAGTIAGIVVLVGSGGLAAPLVAGAAAAYGGVRAGMALDEKSDLGHDISDLGDPEIRALWLEAGSSVLSIGAIGGGIRAARLIKQGGKMSRAGANIVAGMTHTGNLVDAVAMGDTVNTLSNNWDKMTPEQKSQALLSLSFQFGMNAASNKANGGRFSDNFNFKKTRNQLEFGTPFDVVKNPKLKPGEVAVTYDKPTAENPYPSKFKITYNGDKPPSRAMIDLHSQAASAMEASVGLQKRYKSMVADGQEPKAGTAAWEAKFELTKISAEAELVLKRLSSGDLSPEETGRLKARMDELNAALIEERGRLDAWEKDKSITTPGKGKVAAPVTGETQRDALKWPDAPDDHIWVAGPGERPYLRRKDGSGVRMFYDESKKAFVKHSERPDADMRVVGSGDNEMTFLVRGDGKTAETHATLRKYHVGAERSSQELSAQNRVGKQGHDTDEGGHMVGHRFGLDHGADNMFPQDANFNKGAYKAMENEFAAWIDAGCEVQLSVTLSKYSGDRPQTVTVRYKVVDKTTGKVVHAPQKRFANDGNQTFKRLDRAEIAAKVAAAN